MAEDLKKRCREVMQEMDRHEQLEQRKYALMDELHAAILWHEQCKNPTRSRDELNYWLGKELEIYEFPHVSLVGKIKERLFNWMASRPDSDLWSRVEYMNVAEPRDAVAEGRKSPDDIERILRALTPDTPLSPIEAEVPIEMSEADLIYLDGRDSPLLHEMNGHFDEAGTSTMADYL